MNTYSRDSAICRNDFLGMALKASLLAGDAVMHVYNSDFEVVFKSDKSPLTEADRQSHEILKAQLGDKIPLLSEEGAKKAYETRK
jgi:3'(2'), 5'-bisphosphate nucleotidase